MKTNVKLSLLAIAALNLSACTSADFSAVSEGLSRAGYPPSSGFTGSSYSSNTSADSEAISQELRNTLSTMSEAQQNLNNARALRMQTER